MLELRIISNEKKLKECGLKDYFKKHKIQCLETEKCVFVLILKHRKLYKLLKELETNDVYVKDVRTL